MVTEDNIMQVLKTVKDPEIGASIVNLGMVRAVEVRGNTVGIQIALTAPNCPARATIKDDVVKAVSKVEGVSKVDVQFSSMTTQEAGKVAQEAADHSIAPPQGDSQQSRASAMMGIEKLPKHKFGQIIAITSGKGGVGKSLVTGLLAVELQRHGYSVGILDADLTGASIGKIFGVTSRPVWTSPHPPPPASRTGIKLMSMGFLMDRPDAALIWRGPLINSAIRQFYNDFDWGDVDFLLVDLPPGTSDAPLSVFQSLPLDAALVISFPQELVVVIVGKAINLAKTMESPILGLVENMSYATCPDCGKKIELFGSSKGKEASADAKIEFLGSIPLDPMISRLCDAGKLEDYKSPEFEAIAQRVIEKMKQLKLIRKQEAVQKSEEKESGR
jgi:Mrp family chromosome partitioning ATPase